METTTEKKSNANIYKVIIAVMALIIVILIWQLVVTKKEVIVYTKGQEKAQVQSNKLQHELDSLVIEHTKIKNANKMLSGKLSMKDSIILAKADEIQKLIASQADYYKIKRKLDYLRNIEQGYVTQMDSLYRVNKVLKEENVKVKDNLEKEKVKTTELTKVKEQLSDKVTLASTLKAYGIKAVPVKLKSGGKKEEVTEKARKADKIKITFTLSENLIAPSGNKTIYLRIARPDQKILSITQGDEYSFDTPDGKKLQYSAKKDIDYENKQMEITIYWDKTDDFIPGTYVASVFTDGYCIGESSFNMK